ncbi:MAG TPA: branched-chain amino acid ABC transporter permease [Bacillota bacterium]|nr:branched-chain amino acid ABC transporter permease [Bacillota bacterium]
MNRKKMPNRNFITYALAIAFYVFMMILTVTGTASRHLESMLVPICINIILAVSLNLVVGILGDLSLGHAGFMSIGAYAGCLFSQATQNNLITWLRFPLAILVGGFVAAIFGIVIGIPVLRLKGDYLAIVTLAFGEIVRSIIINLNFTGGASGLKGTPQDVSFTSAFVVVLITLIVILNLIDSKHGRAIMSLRENSIAAESCGINIRTYKLAAFILAAFFAGTAGVLYGHNYSILIASTFDYNKSIEILVIVVLGGMGSIRGSMIAAALLTVLPEALRFMSEYRMLLYALILIVMMILNASPKYREMKRKIGGNFAGLLNPNKKEADLYD